MKTSFACPHSFASVLLSFANVILHGLDRSDIYANMPAKDWLAMLEILRQTKPEFTAWLRQQSAP